LLKLLLEWGPSALFAAICGFALWKGDRTEKLGAGLLLVAWAASFVAQQDTGLLNTQYAVLAIDVVALGALSFLAWRSERSWPVWAAAFQAIEVAVHIAKGAGLRIPGIAYIAAVNLSSYGVMAALAVGAWIAWREREALSMASQPKR
jgi:hypothetical protein